MIFCSKIVLFIGWIIFLVLAYKASQIEIEHKEYDPFIILNIDRVKNRITNM
jgi:preprotein translocase subunit Sec63